MLNSTIIKLLFEFVLNVQIIIYLCDEPRVWFTSNDPISSAMMWMKRRGVYEMRLLDLHTDFYPKTRKIREKGLGCD